MVGSVGQIHQRLQRARKVVLLKASEGLILGVAALKTPEDGYRTSTFANAGIPIAGFETAPELGYVVVAPEMKGKRLSGVLVAEVAKDTTVPLFSTTDNLTIKHNLERAGFEKVGREWLGKKGTLSLWTKSTR